MTSVNPDTWNPPAPSGVLELRDGSVDDAEAIEAVHFSAREAVYEGRVEEWPPPGLVRAGRIARWREWLGDPEIDCIVGWSNGDVVGFCTVRGSQDEDADPRLVAEMPTLYVSPKYWHSGFGRSLCHAGVERAAERGYRKLTLWVLEMNRQAREFYDAFGFRPDDATKIDEGTRERLVAMRYGLDLQGPVS